MLAQKSLVTQSRPKVLAIAALVLAPSVLSGCADARSSRTRGPDDHDGWLKVTCRQQHRNCYDEAAKQCPMGFDAAQNQGRYDAGNDVPFYSGYMLVRCKTQVTDAPG